MELVTTDKIINFLKEQVENKHPVSPQMWLDAAMKLNVLVGDESEKLAELEMLVSQAKVEELKNQDKRSVSMAEVYVEATELYKQMRQQKSKVDQVIEFIRLAKKQAALQENIIQNI